MADCTVGLGGHATALGRAIGPSGTLVLNDLDVGNLALATERIRGALGDSTPTLVAHAGNFSLLPRRMAELGLRADVVLADLGFSSSQVDDPSRGFSFSADGPLDMRLAQATGPSAAELIASLPEAELARIIREYGEERHAGTIARKLAGARREHPISTTSELARIVRSAAGRSAAGGIDPATRTFQAIRIAVNDELGNLDALLHAFRGGMLPAPRPDWLAPGARVGVISFHSLEDRPVKQMFARLESEGLATDLIDGCATATEDEIRSNPRARSAKLRAVRRR